MGAPVSEWTEERVALARHLFIDQGLSASLVGKQMGVSRNSVIGIMFRRGYRRDLPSKPIDRLPDGRPPRAPSVPRVLRALTDHGFSQSVRRAPQPIAEPVLTLVPADAKHWTERRSRECAAPIGSGADLLSCCAAVKPGSQYCPPCHARFYVGQGPRLRAYDPTIKSSARVRA